MQMWRRFLGPYARIIGLDNRPECINFVGDQISVRIGDQSDPSFLAEVVKEFGPPDIVLDDGSHIMDHVKASFKALYPEVSKNGVYAVEDLHTAYWSELAADCADGTFIEQCKSLIDEMNADHTRGAVEPSPFSKSTLSMHIYDSVIVFEKGRHNPKISSQFRGQA